ncbi:MAG: hypothetical protein Q9M20_08330 [Mariprofundaceae bacterium]|nr:hypothetical protein [Mariprofundaceae bacterium]
MLTKKLLFVLGTLFFLIAMLGMSIFKVEEISIAVPKTSMQSKMEPIFFIDGKSGNIKYEILDPTVKVLDSGEVSIKANLNLLSGLEKDWGSIELISKVFFRESSKAFYLEIPGNVQLKVAGKSSSDTDFKLWGESTTALVATITDQINVFLATKDISSLSGSNLRHQAEGLTIRQVNKTDTGIDIVLNVKQGASIIVVYTVMFLSAFIFACGYFFVGGVVGFRDEHEMVYKDPKKIPKKIVKEK